MIPPPGYSTANPLTVAATTAVGGSTTIPVPADGTDYAVRVYLTGNAANLVYLRLRDQAAGSDLTVWWTDGGGIQRQIDVDVESVSSAAISLWFKLQSPIGANSSDGNYLLAYGNAAPTIKANWSNIYNLADDFLGSSLDATKWQALYGVTASVSTSVLTIVNGPPSPTPTTPATPAVESLRQWSVNYAIRARGAMPYAATTGHTSIRFYNGDVAQTGGATRYQALIYADAIYYQVSPTNYVVASFNDSANAYSVASPALIPFTGATRIWNIGRDSAGYAHGWVDEGPVSVTTGQPAPHAGYVFLCPSNVGGPAGVLSQTWDWVKVRSYVPQEPVVSVGFAVFSPPPAVGWPFA